MRLKNLILMTILVFTAVALASCTPGTGGEPPAATGTTAPPAETTEPTVEPTAAPTATTEPTTEPAETAEPATPTPEGDTSVLAGTAWTLVSFGPAGAEEPVVPGSEVTLTFDAAGQAGGSGGCNSYGGSYQTDGDNITFGEIVSTLMACTDDALNEQESRFLAALGSASTFALEGDNLTIGYDGGQGVLNFVREGAATPTPSGDAGVPVLLRELFMIDATNGWALGQVEGDPAEQVLFTADGGESWQVRTPADAPAVEAGMEQTLPLAAFFDSASRGWMAFSLPAPVPADATPVVWRTEDGGASWEASAPLDLGDMPYDYFVPSDLGFLEGGFGWMLAHLGAGMNHDYIAVYTTADGGATWQRVSDPNASPDIQSCNKSGLVFTGESDAWLSGDCPGLMPQLFFYRSTDGGATWSPVLLPLVEGQTAASPEQLGDSCGVRQLTPVEGTLFLALHCFDFDANTSQAYLYRTEDGESWTASPLPAPHGLFDFISPDEGWYLGEDEAGAAVLFHTADGGQSWQTQVAPPRPGQVAFVDAQNGWVLTGVGVGDAPELWRLASGGTTWEQLSPVATP